MNVQLRIQITSLCIDTNKVELSEINLEGFCFCIIFYQRRILFLNRVPFSNSRRKVRATGCIDRLPFILQ